MAIRPSRQPEQGARWAPARPLPRRVLLAMLLVGLGAGLAPIGCSGAQLQPETRRVAVEIAGRPVTVDLAASKEARCLWLRLRNSTPARPMLLAYPDSQVRILYAEDLLIPLTVMFVGADGRLQSPVPLRAGSDDSAASSAPCSLVLVSPASRLDALAIRSGDPLVVPAAVRRIAADAWRKDRKAAEAERRDWGWHLAPIPNE